MPQYRCIYTGADETTATFHDAEHIFPKCIGGVNCLPKGWVSDQVNRTFSKMELDFARQYPLVATHRMFSPPMGRKKHKNREKVGILRDTDHGTGYALGYIRNCKPFPLSQIVVTTELPDEIPTGLPIRIVFAPNPSLTHEQQAARFWEQMAAYNGSPTCIKGKNLPSHTYLLGVQDNRWVLAVPASENPEDIKPRMVKLIKRIVDAGIDYFWPRDGDGVHSVVHHVNAGFAFCFSMVDCLRVYAKIAVNCLAKLKGLECVFSPALDEIKRAILTGERIQEFAWHSNKGSIGVTFFQQFPQQLTLGDQAHSAVFFQDETRDLMAAVSLFGVDSAVVIRLGRFPEHIGVDCYICDWQNGADYTMTECVMKVCRYGEEKWDELTAKS